MWTVDIAEAIGHRQVARSARPDLLAKEQARQDRRLRIAEVDLDRFKRERGCVSIRTPATRTPRSDCASEHAYSVPA